MEIFLFCNGFFDFIFLIFSPFFLWLVTCLLLELSWVRWLFTMIFPYFCFQSQLGSRTINMCKMEIGSQKDLFICLFFFQVFRVWISFKLWARICVYFYYMKIYCIFLVDVWIKIKRGMGYYKKTCNNIYKSYIKLNIYKKLKQILYSLYWANIL